MRGFGHVKLANVALARIREAELLHRFEAPRPVLKGIRVTAAAVCR
jgi:indolepyruvate ferredoxin oxidoreductase